MYIDYVETEEGHHWQVPLEDALDLPVFHTESAALRLVKALSGAGCAEPEGLSLIGEIWRPVLLSDDFHCSQLTALNRKTLEEMDSRGMLRPQPDRTYETVIRDWLFPLHQLDLREAKTDRDQLRQVQSEWSTDAW